MYFAHIALTFACFNALLGLGASTGDISNDEEKNKEVLNGQAFVALLDIEFTDRSKKTCTGSIIHNHVVITVAHCFKTKYNADAKPQLAASFVVVGNKQMFENSYEEYLPIEKIVTHPKYKGWTADLSLVFTFASMTHRHGGSIIPLAGEKTVTHVDANVTILSWGQISDDLGCDENNCKSEENDYDNSCLSEEEENATPEKTTFTKSIVRSKKKKNKADYETEDDNVSSSDENKKIAVQNKEDLYEEIPSSETERNSALPYLDEPNIELKKIKKEIERQNRMDHHKNTRKTLIRERKPNKDSTLPSIYLTQKQESLVSKVKRPLKIRYQQHQRATNDDDKDDYSSKELQPDATAIVTPSEETEDETNNPESKSDIDLESTNKEDFFLNREHNIAMDVEKLSKSLEDRSFDKATDKNSKEQLTQNSSFTNLNSYYKGWRRQTANQKNELTVEIFGFVNIRSCKLIVQNSKSKAYDISRTNDVMCYSSTQRYISEADSGAPAIREGQLIAVTVGGAKCDGDQVGIGLKMSCYCSWIADNIPDGHKLNCCDNCCGIEHKKPVIENNRNVTMIT